MGVASMKTLCGRYALRSNLKQRDRKDRHTVEERLEALERRLKRRTFIELAVFVLAAVVLGINLASVDYSINNVGADLLLLQEGMTTGLKSQQFVLLDQQGEVRGYITGTEGRGTLMLLDGNGKPRIVADAGKKAPGLELLDAEGKAMLSLLVDPLGNSVLIRSPKPDSGAALHAVVGVTGPRLRLLGNEGRDVGPGL